MIAVLALLLGLLGVGYSVWPILRGQKNMPRLSDEALYADVAALIEGDARVLREWSAAAGETPTGPPVEQTSAPPAGRGTR